MKRAPRLAVDMRLLALPLRSYPALGGDWYDRVGVSLAPDAGAPLPDVDFDALLAAPFLHEVGAQAVLAHARSLCGLRPLIAITADNCLLQRTLALQGGADDAVSPDCSETEMAARVLALLRRHAMQGGQLCCDDLEIDLIARHVARAGRSIRLPLREYDLLACLARSRDRVVRREDLLRSVWRLDFDPGTNRIDVHIARLRRRVDAGQPHAMVRTVKGVGYALVSRAGAHRFATDRHLPG